MIAVRLPTRWRSRLHHRMRATLWMLGSIALGLVTWKAASAISDGSLAIERIDGDGWNATGVELAIDLRAEPISATLRIDRMQFDVLSHTDDQTLRDLKIKCFRVELQGRQVRCRDTQVTARLASLGNQSLRGAVEYDRMTGALSFSLSGIKLARGNAQVSGEWRGSKWNARVLAEKINVGDLTKLLRPLWTTMPALTLAGECDIDLALRGRLSSLERIDWRFAARQLNLSNAAGSLATERLSMESKGVLEPLSNATGWKFSATMSSGSGQAFFEPIFFNLSEQGFESSFEGEWSKARLSLRQLSVEHKGALSASGNLSLSLEPLSIERAHLNVARAELAGAYSIYAQPFLINSVLGSLKGQGSIEGTVDVRANAPTLLALDLHDASVTDTQNRFAVTRVNGSIRWADKDDARDPSNLHWQSAKALGIEIGAGAIDFRTSGRSFSLLEPSRIPLLDGALSVSEFGVRDAGQEDMTLRLDALLEPISVQKLSLAFGWPPFGGRLGGRLANLRLHNGVLTLGATLNAEVFDGRVSVANLRMESPFGKWPRFSADIAIDQVDLEQVTSAFSFGTITGRLSGEIKDLELFDWAPVAFDARLYTPPKDKSRHRISQRAVQNIGNLGGAGGGVTAALSSGFLRFFENFNYERLGISCRLENEVCTMGGVEPAGTGYYLVKGSGVPRINVVGNATRVDWPRMVAQLKAATESKEIQVK